MADREESGEKTITTSAAPLNSAREQVESTDGTVQF